MASSFLDEGLPSLWSAALGIPGSATPSTADLIANPFAPSPALTYSSFSWEGAHKVLVTPLWTVTLFPATHTVVAVCTVTFTFSSAYAGQVFYGIGLHSAAGAPAFYCETFPAPYQVPIGGGVLTWTFNLVFGDCANAGH